MTASVELAFVALILWLSAVLDAMVFSSAVETLVVSWRRVSFTLPLLLLFPQEGTDVFFSSRSQPYLRRFHLVETFAGSGFLPCSHIHVIHFQITTDFFYGDERGIIVAGTSTGREELVVDARVYVVF